ncbi:MAG: dihydrofolate reductase [Provencibacterium sp.]|nr:dihydrofolate reductase [Provencibacterium sp.]
MRKATLYIATSLDGYIADSSGKVDWLHGQDGDEKNIDTYSAFIKDMDTVVMGWKTYHQVATELSPDEWIYSALTSYIITHRRLPSTENIKFVQEDPCRIVQKLKQEPGRGIWICGGANIVQPLVKAELIDEYYISIIPTLLGSGIRLWGEADKEMKLKLMRAQSYNGITELIYTRR